MKLFYVILGCIGLGLGAVGAAVPLLPAFPFLMLAAFCFARSSRRLNDWFLSTRLYKNNLESFVRGRGMTRAAKLRIMGVVTDDGLRLRHDGTRACGTRRIGGGVGMSYPVLYLRHQDHCSGGNRRTAGRCPDERG